MEIKQNTSNIIHLGKEDINIQKEIFNELLKKNENNSKNKQDKIKVGIDDMVTIIFGNEDKTNKKTETNFSKTDNEIPYFMN